LRANGSRRGVSEGRAFSPTSLAGDFAWGPPESRASVAAASAAAADAADAATADAATFAPGWRGDSRAKSDAARRSSGHLWERQSSDGAWPAEDLVAPERPSGGLSPRKGGTTGRNSGSARGPVPPCESAVRGASGGGASGGASGSDGGRSTSALRRKLDDLHEYYQASVTGSSRTGSPGSVPTPGPPPDDAGRPRSNGPGGPRGVDEVSPLVERVPHPASSTAAKARYHASRSASPASSTRSSEPPGLHSPYSPAAAPHRHSLPRRPSVSTARVRAPNGESRGDIRTLAALAAAKRHATSASAPQGAPPGPTPKPKHPSPARGGNRYHEAGDLRSDGQRVNEEASADGSCFGEDEPAERPAERSHPRVASRAAAATAPSGTGSNGVSRAALGAVSGPPAPGPTTTTGGAEVRHHPRYREFYFMRWKLGLGASLVAQQMQQIGLDPEVQNTTL
jgi:hypothetical protein